MDEIPAKVEDVLRTQHSELIDRLDAWLARLEGAVDRSRVVAFAPPSLQDGSDRPQEMSWALGAMDREESPPASPGRRKTIMVQQYEEAQDEAIRFESHHLNNIFDEDVPQSRTAACWSACQSKAERISTSVAFNIAVAFIIISNSIFLGVQLEWSAASTRNGSPDAGEEAGRAFMIGHLLYAVIFTLEMAVRFVAIGPWKFFCGKDYVWNWLDMTVVIPAWIELAIDIGGSANNFRVIRVFRITRLLQLIRSVRLVRFISAFRELVLSVIDTVRQVVWAMLLLVLMIYSFGILFTDMALQYLEETSDPVLDNFFGSVYQSCSTLFRALLEGFDWVTAADALQPVGVIWVQFFHVYMTVGGLAILNVITGVFVNSAIKTRERDQETLLRHVQQFKKLVADLWKKIDKNGLGRITIAEFEVLFSDQEMRTFFDAIEVNAVDAWTLFDALDADGDHLISYEEFAQRCMQLHGTARAVDLFALTQQSTKLWEQVQEMEQTQIKVAAQLAWLSRTLAVLVPEGAGAQPLSGQEMVPEESAELVTVEVKWADDSAPAATTSNVI